MFRIYAAAMVLMAGLLSPSTADVPFDDDPVYVIDVIDQVMRWEPLVRQEISDHPQYKYVTEEQVPLVLAIIAQESHGIPDLVQGDHWGSTGLMQVGPRDWVATSEELKSPRLNVQWGIWFLNGSYSLADGDTISALRYYNCGKLEGTCGVGYADLIIDFWLPRIEHRINGASKALNVPALLLRIEAKGYAIR